MKNEGQKIGKIPFEHVEFQLASLASELPESGDWLYEMKYDGYRVMAFVDGGGARLMTRGGHDYSARFPAVARELTTLFGGGGAVFDGELVAIDENGRSDFTLLQQSLGGKTNSKISVKSGGENGGGGGEKRDGECGDIIYVVFDLLFADGEDLRGLPLWQRKARLQKMLTKPAKNLHFAVHSLEFDQSMLADLCSGGYEGIVAKLADAPYIGGRGGDWLKLKCARRQEFVVGGYTVKNRAVSSLLVGYFDGGQLVLAGGVGSGISERAAAEMLPKFAGARRDSSPFLGVSDGDLDGDLNGISGFADNSAGFRANSGETHIEWLDPKLVAEVQFSEWTRTGRLRHPVFKGLREDKNPAEIVRE